MFGKLEYNKITENQKSIGMRENSKKKQKWDLETIKNRVLLKTIGIKWVLYYKSSLKRQSILQSHYKSSLNRSIQTLFIIVFKIQDNTLKYKLK